jgi:hypothetical protein
MDRALFVRPELPDPALDLDADPALDDLLQLAGQRPGQVKVTETRGVGRNRTKTYYRFRIQGTVRYQGRLYEWASTASPACRDRDHIAWSVSHLHPSQVALDLYEEHARIAATQPGLTAVIDRLYGRLCEHLSARDLGGNRPQKMWLNLYDLVAETGRQHLYGSPFATAMNEAFGLQQWSDLGAAAVRIDEPGPFCTTLEQWIELPGHEVQRTGSDVRYTGAHAPRETPWPGAASKYMVIAGQHRAEVQRCLTERRPVTGDVLSEYPDLAMQAEEKGLSRPPVDGSYQPLWMRTRDACCVSRPMHAGGVPIGRIDRAKERYHEIAVQDAVARGYPVPSDVCAYYVIEAAPGQLVSSSTTDERAPPAPIPADRAEDAVAGLVQAAPEGARTDHIEAEVETPPECSEHAEPEPVSVTPAMLYDAWETYLGRDAAELTEEVRENYHLRALEMFLSGKRRDTEVARHFRRFCRLYLHAQAYGWGEPFAQVKTAFDAGADNALHAPLESWRPALGPRWLTPIAEWDIGWETAGPLDVDAAVTCSRCRSTPRSDEDWVRGWQGDNPAEASKVYLCPACQDELHRFRAWQLQARRAEGEEHRHRARARRIGKLVKLQALREQRRGRDPAGPPSCDNAYPLVLDGGPLIGTPDPTMPGCTAQRATRRATLEAEGMTATFVLCDACAGALRASARAYGIRFSSEALPACSGDVPGGRRYSAEDLAAYEGHWDVYFETGSVRAVRRTVRRIDAVGILHVAYERADRGASASTLDERRRIIRQRIRQLERRSKAA